MGTPWIPSRTFQVCPAFASATQADCHASLYRGLDHDLVTYTHLPSRSNSKSVTSVPRHQKVASRLSGPNQQPWPGASRHPNAAQPLRSFRGRGLPAHAPRESRGETGADCTPPGPLQKDAKHAKTRSREPGWSWRPLRASIQNRARFAPPGFLEPVIGWTSEDIGIGQRRPIPAADVPAGFIDSD